VRSMAAHRLALNSGQFHGPVSASHISSGDDHGGRAQLVWGYTPNG
jgi:hypothetical protein